ncbi:hypothetical protein M0R45_016249 [Rubus argutus]|uniref:Uncharacterized protein n=1 Tax=Rubus argutus TaxID=59490 RepID=A0AAW1XVN9_RUBAR
MKGNVPIVKHLVVLMGEVRDNDGDTALHIAVKKEQLDIVKELVLLMRHEDLLIKNEQGYTALHLAINKGNVPFVKELVTKEKGQDDFDRYIPFTSCVIKGDWNKAKECLGQLDDPYEAITRVDPRDGLGDTALHAAAREGHAHIVKELVLLLKVRQEKDLKLKTAQDFTTFGSGIHQGTDGAHLIRNCLRAKKLDMALDLLQRCPSVAIIATGSDQRFPIMELAAMHSAFLSGTKLGFWQNFIYNRLHIEPANLNIHDTYINISKQEDDRHNQMDLHLLRYVACQTYKL